MDNTNCKIKTDVKDDIIIIPRKSSSINLFKLPVSLVKSNSNNQDDITLLNYQDLFDHVQTNGKFNGVHWIYCYVNKSNCKMTLYMRSIKSVADYLYRYYNQLNLQINKKYSEKSNYSN